MRILQEGQAKNKPVPDITANKEGKKKLKIVANKTRITMIFPDEETEEDMWHLGKIIQALMV